MSTEYDPYGPQPEPRRRMSTGTKVLLILLAVVGGMLLLCCGAGIYIVSGLSRSIEETPEAAREMTRGIAEIDVPDRFEPQGAARWNLLIANARMAWYKPTQAKGGLMLMEINVRVGDPDQLREQMRTEMQPRGEQRRELRIERSETRRFTIRGEEVDFTFAEAVNPETDEEYRLVRGSFPGREGIAILILEIEKEAYDEAEIVEMLESIQ